MTATTHPQSASVCDGRLYVAFELSNKSWVLALTAGFGAPIWEQRMIPQDWRKLQQVLAKARAKFSLAAEARVVSCYEAGRDGFWLHDALLAQGLENRVVDSSSIEVNRRARRNKTDRIDARKLVQQLVRVALGERHVWREVRVPPVAERAARHCSRGRHTLVAEQTRLINQLRGWLQTWGATLPTRRGAAWWERVRDWRGETLPAEVQEQLALASARLAKRDVKFYACHQATSWLRRLTQEAAELSAARFCDTFEWTASLWGANVPFVLSHAVQNKLLTHGDLALLVSPGAGETWSCVALRWAHQRHAAFGASSS